MESEDVRYGTMNLDEMSFCLDGLAEVLVNALIAALKTDPQILEALILATKYGESQT